MKSLSVNLGIFLVAIGLFCPYNSFAERDSIWVGGMEVKIGMPKTTVLSKIVNNYQITKDELSDTWRILPKEGGNMVGAIDFRDEKVSSVTKFWGSFSKNEGFEFATNFFNLLSNLKTEGANITSFETFSSKEPKSSLLVIHFFCGAKEVQLYIGEDEKYGRYMQINESLRK